MNRTHLHRPTSRGSLFQWSVADRTVAACGIDPIGEQPPSGLILTARIADNRGRFPALHSGCTTNRKELSGRPLRHGTWPEVTAAEKKPRSGAYPHPDWPGFPSNSTASWPGSEMSLVSPLGHRRRPDVRLEQHHQPDQHRQGDAVPEDEAAGPPPPVPSARSPRRRRRCSGRRSSCPSPRRCCSPPPAGSPRRPGSSGSTPDSASCVAVTACRPPNMAFDEVSDPVRATPSQPSSAAKSG